MSSAPATSWPSSGSSRARVGCVEDFERDTSAGQAARDVSKVRHPFSGVGDVDRARPLVADGSSRIASDTRHELVVELEATDRKIEKQRVAILGFRERREHARRRLRRAHARQPVVDDVNRLRRVGPARTRPHIRRFRRRRPECSRNGMRSQEQRVYRDCLP